MQRVKGRSVTGMVYSMTNAAEGNEVIAFRRGVNGKLTRMKAYTTGGNGTGTQAVSPVTPQNGIDPLASQGSLILSRDGCLLFVVNAGSDSISSFRVASSGALTLVGVVHSGGAQPNSLSMYDDILYVSNVGNAENNYDSNITGFEVNKDGSLSQIIGATYSLSTDDAQPASVVFSPHGRKLVISELTTNRLSVFNVDKDGTLTGPTVNNSSGGGPFGSYFLSNGVLLVTEAGVNALSSYTVAADGTLATLSASVKSGQIATCWVVPTRYEHYAYTSNTASGTVTVYRIRNKRTLSVVRNVKSTADEAGAPIDSGVSRDGSNFYVLNGNQGSISVFKIGKDGHLIRVQVIRNTGLPELGSQGLAVR